MALFKPKTKKLSFSHTENEDGTGYIQVYGKVNDAVQTATATHEHENYDKIVEAAKADDLKVFQLFSPLDMLNKMTSLSTRIAYEHGRLYVDGDEANGALVDHILRAVKEKDPNADALVKFYENLLSNPSKHAVEQAWGWLSKHDFTITKDGLIVAYKGVYQTGLDATTYVSSKSGTAFVNGQKYENQVIPYKAGDVVTMPRSEVTFDPKVGCAAGLHVGTWQYAHKFAAGIVLDCRVHPVDIVSVPSEDSEEKMRVCKFEIVDRVAAPHKAAVI